MSQHQRGVWALLSGNANFVRLWMAQLISFAGDWINSVALLGLVLQLTDNGMMVSLLIVANTLPLFFLMPIAGVVADRFDRRRIMIASNLAQALLALGFLFVQRPDQVWMIYLFSVGMVAGEAFFIPASGAALPNIVAPPQLGAANALAGASWGTMVAVGSALGGLVSARWGRDAAFVLNAVSFVVAAALVMSVRVPFAAGPAAKPEEGDSSIEIPNTTMHEAVRVPASEAPPSASNLLTTALQTALADFREGLRYASQHRNVFSLLLIKACWGLGGGVIALLSVIPVEVLGAGDSGIGMLYASRGVGALLGPLLAQMVVRDRRTHMAVLAALGVVISGAFYILFALAPSMQLAMLFVFLAHLGGGMQWVLTSTLLQKTVADRMLGRISSLDMAGLTLTMTISNLVCGIGIRNPSVGPRMVGAAAGLLLLVLGGGWILYFGVLRRPDFDHRDADNTA